MGSDESSASSLGRNRSKDENQGNNDNNDDLSDATPSAVEPETKVIRTDTTTVTTTVSREAEPPVVTEREIRIDPTLPEYNQHSKNVATKTKKGPSGESTITTTTIREGLTSETIVETKTTTVKVVNKRTGHEQAGEKMADERDGGDSKKVTAVCCMPIPCTIL